MTMEASYQHQGGRLERASALLRSSRERSTEDKNPLKFLKRFGEAMALTRCEPRGELGIAW